MGGDWKFWLALAAAAYFLGETLELRSMMRETYPFMLKGAELHGCPITPQMRAQAASIEQEWVARGQDPALWGHRRLWT